MKALQLLDEFVLDHFQSVSEWIYHLVGVTCFQVARLCYAAATAALIWGVAHYLANGDGPWGHSLDYLLIIVWARSAFFQSEYEKSVESSAERVSNPRKIDVGGRISRMCFYLVFVPLVWVAFADDPAFGVEGTSLMFAHLFNACDPLPPELQRANE